LWSFSLRSTIRPLVLRVAIAAFLAVSLTAAPALAGTASVTSGGFQYLAAPGEMNDLSVTATSIGDPRVWEFTDTGGSAVLAGPGCALADADTVVCTRPEEDFFQDDDLFVLLGDMDDSVTVANLCPTCSEVGTGPFWSIILFGQAGADEITGGMVGQLNRLLGGEGNDTLTGGMIGELFVGGPGSDLIDGGPDEPEFTVEDIVSYENSLFPVRVDFDRVADDGAPGENDTLVRIDGAFGTRGADVLVGDGGENVFNGGGGADLVLGGGGDDWLEGGRQGDVIKGGPGNDTIGGELGHDTIRGGPGNDYLIGGDAHGSFDGGDVPDPNGMDVIRGGPGNDFLQGDGGADRLYGEDGDDSIHGLRGGDLQVGGRGRDFLGGCFDNAVDRLFGGQGIDTSYRQRFDSVFQIEDPRDCGGH
jgi:Ca2+-binding RTX toxin-like protein